MMNKEKDFISAVIYVHNAENRIGNFLRTIIEIMESNFEYSEIICVNDASDDNSLNVIKETSKTAVKTSVTVVNMSFFHGLEPAMVAGVDLSIGDLVYEFDNTNLDFDVDMIMNIYRRAHEGYDIVSASPDAREKLSSRIFYLVFDRFGNLSYRMSTERFRIISRRAINRVGSMNKNILYRKAIYANCGLKTDNMKYSVKNVRSEVSDMREGSYRSRLAVDSLILFTEMGYRFSVIMAALMMFITLFIVIYAVVMYFTLHPVEGWTTTILFMSVCFFGLFGIQTIIIKYLQLLVDMVYKRKHYSFESIEKLTK